MMSSTSPLISLKPTLRRRFYGSVVLAVALNKVLQGSSETSSRTPNSDSDGHNVAEEAYHRFVYRLAHICDSENYGRTITAIAVLEEPDGIRYLVGSNERTAEELQKVKDYLTEILSLVGKSDLNNTKGIRMLVRAVIQFNLPRIKSYVASLAKALGLCIAHYERQMQAISDAEAGHLDISQTLSKLKAMTSFSSNSALNHDTYVLACLELVYEIHLNSQCSDFEDAIIQRAKEGQMDSSAHWAELRHVLNRLHAYYQDVKTIVRAKQRWIRLFHDFKVTAVPSSKPDPNPLKANSRSKALTAHEAIGRMTKDEETARYRGYAAELQTFPFELDKQISAETDNPNFTPIVHAEILVQSEALRRIRAGKQGGCATRFYSNWKYVGSSKPTCLLCGYYFELHPAGVQVRPSHRNMYPRWRLPDVHDAASDKFRSDILNGMKKKVCEAAFQTLQERVPQGKSHDSNTTSLMPGYLFSGDTDTRGSVGDFASRVSWMSIGRGVGLNREAPPSGKSSLPLTQELEEADEDLFDSNSHHSGSEDSKSVSGKGGTSEDAEQSEDDEGGGVLLYFGRR